jgi:hypothetical protein
MGRRALLRFGPAVWLLTAVPAWGQSPAPSLASTFDVASIRPSKPSDAPESIRPFWHGSLSATNATVHDLMTYAYFPVHTYNVLGGPGWTRSDRYDIEAKVVKPMIVLPRLRYFRLDYRRFWRIASNLQFIARRGSFPYIGWSPRKVGRSSPRPKTAVAWFRI